jgi:hypothetical protein
MLANCREALPEGDLSHVTVHDIGLTVLRDPPNPIAEYANLLAYLGCRLIQGQYRLCTWPSRASKKDVGLPSKRGFQPGGLSEEKEFSISRIKGTDLAQECCRLWE